ncbi:hypothetical protein GCM10027610_006670 [Dactylosporangium cerinum]
MRPRAVHRRSQATNPPAPATATGSHHQPPAVPAGQQRGQGGAGQEQQPAGVEVGGAALGPAGGQDPQRQGDRDEREGEVRQQDQPPAEAWAGHLQHQAAQQRAEHPGDPADERVGAERPGPVAAPEQVLEQADDLRVDHTGAEALDEPGRRDDPAVPCGRGGDRTHREQGEAADEEQAPAVHVAEAARGHQGQAERQRVAGEDPLQRGGAGVQRAAQGGHDDVQHGLVEQRGEPGAEADRDDPPRPTGLDRHRCGGQRHRPIVYLYFR